MAFITRTFILAIICTGLAAQDVQVAAGEILGLVNKDKNGVFQLILKEAAKRSGVSYQENVYPLKRALAKFLNKESWLSIP